MKRIYILIRSKGGKTAEERFQEFLEHKIFERIRQHKHKCLEKLTFLEGNIENAELGKWRKYRGKISKLF